MFEQLDALKTKEKKDRNKLTVRICVNERRFSSQPSCGPSGGFLMAERLEQVIAQRGWPVDVVPSVCLGMCATGPNVRINPGGPIFNQVNPNALQEIVDHLKQRIINQ
jgi:(2Fe-2S) ferredoxin